MLSKNRFTSVTKKKTFSGVFLSVLFVLTLLLILFNKTDYYIANKLKHVGVDIISPITKIISAPVTIVTNIGLRLNNIRYLEGENLKLKQEIIRLKKWQTLAIKNTRENRVFKRLLNSTSNKIEIIKTASVINHTINLYVNAITINAGLEHKVKEDLAVINEKGLVGKTVTSSNQNSKVLLINDQTSSVPVKNLSDKSYSIVRGTANGKYLISAFIKGETLPKVGDLLVTSGNAKIFPRDILVGKVILVREDDYLAIPYVDFNNLGYVQVIKSK